MLVMSALLAGVAEEGLEIGAAAFFEDAALDGDVGGVHEEGPAGAAGAHDGVVGAKDDLADTGLLDGGGAHGARL